jgi:hypothetical protein
MFMRLKVTYRQPNMSEHLSGIPMRKRISGDGEAFVGVGCGLFAAGVGQLQADIVSFSGDLRADATFVACGSDCTLGVSDR